MIVVVEITENNYRNLDVWQETNIVYIPFRFGSEAWVYIFDSIEQFNERFPGILLNKNFVEIEQEFINGEYTNTRYI